MKKRIEKALLIVSVSALLMSGCGDAAPAADNAAEPTLTIETITPPPVVESTEAAVEESTEPVDAVPEGMYRSELTNEPIDLALKDQRPVAVMVDNEKTALQHFGTAEADVIYEIMNSTKNDRITRLMVIVKDWEKITQLGSIRSTRPTNILLAAEWNAVLVHDGGPFYINEYFSRDYAAHFSGGFSRVSNGKAREFTEYVMAGDLDEKFAASSYTTTYNEYRVDGGSHFRFAENGAEVNLEERYDTVSPATQVSLPFKHNGSQLKYNESTKTYDYYEYGTAHLDAEDNEQLTFKNVFIQCCSFTQLDVNGYLVYNCVDNNKEGWYLTNGKAVKVTWTKPDETGVTRFYDGSGEEIEINTGKTYITMVPEDGWSSLSIS